MPCRWENYRPKAARPRSSSWTATRRTARGRSPSKTAPACFPGTGKERAFRLGRRSLLGAWVVMLDADGTYAPDAIPGLVRMLRSGEVDVVMGDREPEPGAMSAVHRFGNTMLSLEASLLYGRECPDVCTGLWGFRGEALRAMPLQATGFELEAELFAVASRMGLRVGHVPVRYLPREGETKLSGARDGLRIGWCLVHRRFASLQAGPRPAPLEHATPVPEDDA